jgi:hypothetical protein
VASSEKSAARMEGATKVFIYGEEAVPHLPLPLPLPLYLNDEEAEEEIEEERRREERLQLFLDDKGARFMLPRFQPVVISLAASTLDWNMRLSD